MLVCGPSADSPCVRDSWLVESGVPTGETPRQPHGGISPHHHVALPAQRHAHPLDVALGAVISGPRMAIYFRINSVAPGHSSTPQSCGFPQLAGERKGETLDCLDFS